MDLVTGGTGFIGSHLVRALLARHRRVRCLVRPSSRRSNLEGLAVEIVTGDLLEFESLRRAARGAETVYHCAADYRLYARDSAELFAHNVLGTQNMLRAAGEAGAAKIVYTSSVGALGLTADGSPANEETPVSENAVVGNYKKSKFRAEQIALSMASAGLPLVVVNPSTPVGELDIKPTPTGQIIVDFLNRRMPAYVETGMNVVDVRDVAAGHLLAAERGRIGEKYILGNRNLSLKQIFDTLSEITGIPSPALKLPHWIPLAAAAAETALSRITGRLPRVSLESVRMSKHRMYFDSSKAVRELGLVQSPVEEALSRAVTWFRDQGYVRR
jgi:dihydroflavonol-4-reductase